MNVTKTNIRRERIPQLCITIREPALGKGICFNMGDTRYPYVCRRTATWWELLSCIIIKRAPLLFWRFRPESTSVSFCRHSLACGPNMASALRAFRAEYYLRRSQWLVESGRVNCQPEPSIPFLLSYKTCKPFILDLCCNTSNDRTTAPPQANIR